MWHLQQVFIYNPDRKVQNSSRTRSEQTQQSRKGRVRHEWGQDFVCPWENFVRKMKTTLLGGFETFWTDNSREKPLIWGELSEGMDSLSQWIPCHKEFLGVVVLGFLWFFSLCFCGFFLEWGVLLLFFLRSKEKSEFCPRKFPGFDNKAASTAAV